MRARRDRNLGASLLITLVFMMILFSILTLLQAQARSDTMQTSALSTQMGREADADSAYDLARLSMANVSPDPSRAAPDFFASGVQKLRVPGGEIELRMQDVDGVFDIYADPLPGPDIQGPLTSNVVSQLNQLRESRIVYPTLPASLAAAGLTENEAATLLEVTTQRGSVIGLRAETCPEALCPGRTLPKGMSGDAIYGQTVRVRIEIGP